jgi:hypothetical protein
MDATPPRLAAERSARVGDHRRRRLGSRAGQAVTRPATSRSSRTSARSPGPQAHGGEPAEAIFESRHRPREARAIADFATTASLYTSGLRNKVAVYQRTSSPWINLATVINADNGRPLILPEPDGRPDDLHPR